MGDSSNKKGFLRKYENKLKNELKNYQDVKLLELLNINNQLSFYNQHTIELYRLRKKLSANLVRKIDSDDNIIFDDLKLMDKKILNLFLKKYSYTNDYFF